MLANYIRLNVARHQQKQPLLLPMHVVDAFRGVLLDDRLDPMLASQILSLPGENEMAELFEVIDPDAIAAVRHALTQTLAQEMADELLAIYRANKLASYRVDQQDMGKRALRNVCLSYLAFADRSQADALAAAQFTNADNMTDSLAAMAASVEAQLPCRDTLLAAFDARWHQDGLVMDKWFALQAGSPASDVLHRMRELLNHRSFSLNNPNRLRSLIGSFCAGNPSAFHAVDGSGYQFLTEMLSDLNTRNPQVASRLIEPLIRLKRYDAARQTLMRQALETLKGLENLSGDLFEKITKALDA